MTLKLTDLLAVTTAERDAMTHLGAGDRVLIFNTDTGGVEVWTGTGWANFGSSGAQRLFISDTDMSPASAGAPTLAEAQAAADAAGTAISRLVWYNGTDLDTSADATYAWFADLAGTLTPVLSPPLVGGLPGMAVCAATGVNGFGPTPGDTMVPITKRAGDLNEGVTHANTIELLAGRTYMIEFARRQGNGQFGLFNKTTGSTLPWATTYSYGVTSGNHQHGVGQYTVGAANEEVGMYVASSGSTTGTFQYGDFRVTEINP